MWGINKIDECESVISLFVFSFRLELFSWGLIFSSINYTSQKSVRYMYWNIDEKLK